MEAEKNLEYYAALPYEIKITPSPEGGYVATIPDLPGCITQGETRLEVLEMIEDAKICWLEAALDLGESIDEPDWDLYNGRLNLRIPKSLHRKLAESAKREGVKLNQLAIYLMANGIGEQLTDKQV
ncbi:MAG: type II toxin-antitoxin system HicB family antitoxin [Selenomonadaceae bacterium]|nr:type II toxin-antitoxin system HicB family antitoxin [Selenomonadaceae bacterium]MBQ6759002.1 type II toxin-antitoxin system HicB family antitoxin [Selenomonadaceae bacterium]MBR0102423.1 type II toxin-antitoxin system HicB family antitoxin [Selenomonadaceae bacterium]MBR2774076.1 type II toxin-antitoxin system HicB family antitoxin [Selenomonadaceae bacterium]